MSDLSSRDTEADSSLGWRGYNVGGVVRVGVLGAAKRSGLLVGLASFWPAVSRRSDRCADPSRFHHGVRVRIRWGYVLEAACPLWTRP